MNASQDTEIKRMAGMGDYLSIRNILYELFYCEIPVKIGVETKLLIFLLSVIQ